MESAERVSDKNERAGVSEHLINQFGVSPAHTPEAWQASATSTERGPLMPHMHTNIYVYYAARLVWAAALTN